MSTSAPRAPFLSKSPFSPITAFRSEVLNYAVGRARADGRLGGRSSSRRRTRLRGVFYRALAKHLSVDFWSTKSTVASRGGVSTAEQGYVPLIETVERLRWLFAPSGSGIFRLMSVVACGERAAALRDHDANASVPRPCAAPAGESRAGGGLSVERVDRDFVRARRLASRTVATAAFALVGSGPLRALLRSTPCIGFAPCRRLSLRRVSAAFRLRVEFSDTRRRRTARTTKRNCPSTRSFLRSIRRPPWRDSSRARSIVSIIREPSST